MHAPLRWLVSLALLFALAAPGNADEGWTDLFANGLDAWKDPAPAWETVGEVTLNPENDKRLSGKAGKGIIFNSAKGTARDLVTKEKFRDVEVHLEFLIAKRSNSGIKLEGLYEIQIYDSHGKKEVDGSDCGGIYPRAELKPKYRHIDKGIAPRVNAAKPAGEWQTLELIFLAPRFDESGKKSANARFVKVVLNGQTIHENVEVPFPTGHAWHDTEVPAGPILLQGDHGPVAFRNVRVREHRK
ncbi:hypothetical protein AYO40_05955 [Planctomycetaceae bacterium SCGC AG-212-D15]|nr:hypothetical protein AYO40_05955 [Planctomycetaceae bacterium SCGC AG-212-D15]